MMNEEGLWKYMELTRNYVAETFMKKSKLSQGSLWKTSSAVMENC